MTKLKRVATGKVFVLKGQVGPIGEIGEQGRVGASGMPGATGQPGPAGPMPAHQVRGDEVRFQNPDGTWGPWVRAVTAPGGGGPDSFNTYTKIAQSTYAIRRTQLGFGTNVFGVNFAGAVTVTLPAGIDKRVIIVINDESGNADSNNITIIVET